MANVKSLSDLNGDDEDKNGKFNDYYAGGEKSGQLLRGAPEDEDDDEEGDDRINALFNRARQSGATAGTSADLPGQQGKAFQGQGRTLGGGIVPSKPPPTDAPRNHVITFYNNGIFTVDDGPPRRVDDPANARFIESISKGECPEELDPGRPGAPVTVNLMRKEEPYSEAERPKQFFTGTGRTLGGGSSGAGPSTSAAATAAAAPADAAAGEWKGVDESKPTTSLQLRLPDGSRMVARFNYGHTVRDIRRFVRASRPDLTAPYQLMTAFPNKVIEGEDQTLEAAGLLNAVIILKQ